MCYFSVKMGGVQLYASLEMAVFTLMQTVSKRMKKNEG